MGSMGSGLEASAVPEMPQGSSQRLGCCWGTGLGSLGLSPTLVGSA